MNIKILNLNEINCVAGGRKNKVKRTKPSATDDNSHFSIPPMALWYGAKYLWTGVFLCLYLVRIEKRFSKNTNKEILDKDYKLVIKYSNLDKFFGFLALLGALI